MRTRGIRTLTVVALAIVATAVGALTASVQADDETARAVLHNGAGDRLGVVKFIQQGDKVLVKADGLEFLTLAPGFKGFHIHAVGSCVAPAFTSAGGHYNPGGTTHGHHAGDMPSLQVNDDHSAWSRFKTDHFDVADIVGKAVIVHAGADNFGNVPLVVGQGGTTTTNQLYTPNSTGTTNDTATGLTANTGNAGARYACGVIEDAN
jgi:Cu-Zn family superoxide dismutase